MAREQLVSFDFGNWGVKFVTESRSDFFRHGIAELSEAEYQNILERQKDDSENTEIMRINGTPYMIGDMAIANGFRERRIGAARYERDYYGVMLAAMLFRNFRKNMRNIMVYGTHPPRDISYRRDMVAAAVGDWTVEHNGEEHTYTVKDLRGLDEPVAGLANIMLSEDGRANKRTPLTSPSKSRAAYNDEVIYQLVVDIGSVTTDYAIIQNSVVDYVSIQSYDLGILEAKERFWADVRSTYRTTFKRGARNFDDRRIHRALRLGELDAGGLGKLDVRHEATQALNELLAQIEGGLDRYEARTVHDIILTGGGSAVVFERLQQRYNHPNMILAHGDIENMHMANVLGAMKALKLLRNRGQI